MNELTLPCTTSSSSGKWNIEIKCLGAVDSVCILLVKVEFTFLILHVLYRMQIFTGVMVSIKTVHLWMVRGVVMYVWLSVGNTNNCMVLIFYWLLLNWRPVVWFRVMEDRFWLGWMIDRVDVRYVLFILHMDRLILRLGGVIHYGLGWTVDWLRRVIHRIVILWLVNVVVMLESSLIVTILMDRLGDIGGR